MGSLELPYLPICLLMELRSNQGFIEDLTHVCSPLGVKLPGATSGKEKKEYPSGYSGPYEKNLVPRQTDMDHPAVLVP